MRGAHHSSSCLPRCKIGTGRVTRHSQFQSPNIQTPNTTGLIFRMYAKKKSISFLCNAMNINMMYFKQLKSLLLIIVFSLSITSVVSETICAYCGEPISGKYVTTGGQSYHEICYRNHIQLRCDYCQEPIDGKYNIFEGKSYHPTCYTNHILPRCDICDQPLEGRYQTDFWGHAYHLEHARVLSECSTCGRLICEQITGGGHKLSDGRFLCTFCNETAVTDEYMIESSLRHVKRLFASEGLDGFPDNIPITLVDKPTLIRLSESYSGNTQGFTEQNIQTLNGKIISRQNHIYILSHLPLTMFQAVLAHELLHVYLFEHGLDLRSNIREGFCNLGSELVYQNSPSEFAQFRLANMQASQNPDYGAGYRKMSGILYKYGWSYLLENLGHIR